MPAQEHLPHPEVIPPAITRRLKSAILPKTMGDQAGKALGIKSNTVGSTCYPKDHSSNVFADKRWLVRAGDTFWMNGP